MSHLTSIGSRTNHHLSACLGIWAGIAVAGCSAGSDQTSRQQPASEGTASPGASAGADTKELVADLVLDSNKIEFWERTAGHLELTETGPIGSAPKVTDKLLSRGSFTAIFEELSGGQAAPARLVEAEARRAAFEANLVRPVAAGTPHLLPQIAPRAGSSLPPSARGPAASADDYDAEASWFLDTFCAAAPQTWRDCRANMAFPDDGHFKVVLEGIGASWFEVSMACHQATGRCQAFSGYDMTGGGDFFYYGYEVPTRNWFSMYWTGVETRGAKFFGWGATDEPGVGTRMSTSVRWTPYPPPAGDCNWAGKFCCDPYRTGTGMCDTTYDSFLYCRQDTGLCSTD
ncbi:MAG TPA: hypothetical protein VK550_06460 [Polyangiaceae bacterium]|nr:hypothetical protein [Polyangiaceae bacterium]